MGVLCLGSFLLCNQLLCLIKVIVKLERTRSLIVFLVSYDCKCSLVVPHSALDLAAVCDIMLTYLFKEKFNQRTSLEEQRWF